MATPILLSSRATRRRHPSPSPLSALPVCSSGYPSFGLPVVSAPDISSPSIASSPPPAPSCNNRRGSSSRFALATATTATTILIHLIVFIQPANSELGVINWAASQPQWLNYGDRAVVTFSFSPPCKNIKLFKKGADSCCHYGRGCWWSPPSSPQSLASSSASLLVAANQTSAASGLYYAVCSDTSTVILYRSNHLFGRARFNLAIGVRPKVFSIEFVNPSARKSAPSQQLHHRQLGGGGVLFEGSVFVAPGKLALVFGVGRGHNPNSTASDQDFVFYVPEFDLADSTFGYNFIHKAPETKLYKPLQHYPEGSRYRYTFRRAKLLNRGLCGIKGTAIAAFGGLHTEQVAFRLNFSFDPFAYAISATRVVAKANNLSSCLFTCKAAVCPHHPNAAFDWTVYSSDWPSFSWRNGSTSTVEEEPNRLYVDDSECRSLYAELRTSRKRSEYHISCRISLPDGRWSKKAVPLRPLLARLFGQDDKLRSNKMAFLSSRLRHGSQQVGLHRHRQHSYYRDRHPHHYYRHAHRKQRQKEKEEEEKQEKQETQHHYQSQRQQQLRYRQRSALVVMKPTQEVTWARRHHYHDQTTATTAKKWKQQPGQEQRHLQQQQQLKDGFVRISKTGPLSAAGDASLQLMTTTMMKMMVGDNKLATGVVTRLFEDTELCANSTWNCRPITGGSDQHLCHANQCAFRCHPLCGNTFCIHHYCTRP